MCGRNAQYCVILIPSEHFYHTEQHLLLIVLLDYILFVFFAPPSFLFANIKQNAEIIHGASCQTMHSVLAFTA